MSASIGNSYALKFKTSEDRRNLFTSYCNHVRKGLSDECFPLCDPQTLRKYIDDFPEDFDTVELYRARAERRLFWESIGIQGTVGRLKGFNSHSWSLNMKNRFGWREKSDVTSEESKIDLPVIFLPEESDV